MDQVQHNRIIEMEKFLNDLQLLCQTLKANIAESEEMLPSYKKLISYYTSDVWRKDFEASNKANFPSPIVLPHGVLSEDAVYNLIMEYREVGERLIQLGEDMLHNDVNA